jgi:hypothetical protein
MRRLGASVFLLLIACHLLEARQRHCMFRLHTEANSNDTTTFSTSVRALFSGKQVAIEKAARITENDVVAFYPYEVSKDNYGALFQLDEHGTIALDAISVERRGTLLFVFINGRAITELQIDKRVTDGKIYIPSGLASRDIESMKKDWRLIGQKKK